MLGVNLGLDSHRVTGGGWPRLQVQPSLRQPCWERRECAPTSGWADHEGEAGPKSPPLPHPDRWGGGGEGRGRLGEASVFV